MNTQRTQAVEVEDEVTTLPSVLPEGSGMISTIVRAELDTQIATAKQYPRSVKSAADAIMSLATLDDQTAAECMYALPRAGKPIRGASVRLAEIAAQQWGNNRVEARVIQIDRLEKVIVAEGTYHDLETNSAVRATVQRRISDKRGRLYSDDMIVTTGNAACSIARRNAILAGVPKAVWRKALEASERVVAGDIKTLSTRRDAAIKAFAAFGVKPEQIFGALDVESMEEITLDDLLTLQAMFSALKNGEGTVEEMFDPRRAGQAFEVVQNPLKDDPVPDAPGVEAQEEGRGDSNQSAAAKLTAAPATNIADELVLAHKRGWETKVAGGKLGDLPTEYHDMQHTKHAEAWIAGFEGKMLTSQKGSDDGRP